MSKFNNAMEVFELLDKSNCRDCGEKTCLAFAGAVFQGRRDLSECPRLDPEVVARYSDNARDKGPSEAEEYLENLKSEIRNIDLAEAAERVGGVFANGKLTVKIMGKDFSVDTQGRLYADIHVNHWVAVPMLSYVLYSAGKPVSGQWVSFRELKNGKERYPLFQKRCEEPLKRIADQYTELFEDMVHIFSGKQVDNHYQSDVAVVLHPLPKVPLLICYWKPDGELGSSLNVFFDATADDNLDIGSIFSLGAGLVQMFEKFSIRHGVPDAAAAR